MTRRRGAWSGQTACCQTVPRECSRPLWAPVSAAVRRAWRHERVVPLTAASLSPAGHRCAMETPLTRSTHHTVTGDTAMPITAL